MAVSKEYIAFILANVTSERKPRSDTGKTRRKYLKGQQKVKLAVVTKRTDGEQLVVAPKLTQEQIDEMRLLQWEREETAKDKHAEMTAEEEAAANAYINAECTAEEEAEYIRREEEREASMRRADVEYLRKIQEAALLKYPDLMD